TMAGSCRSSTWTPAPRTPAPPTGPTNRSSAPSRWIRGGGSGAASPWAPGSSSRSRTDEPERMRQDCLLCRAERVTDWHFEDEECWVTDCMVCRNPIVVWTPHRLPDPELELRLLA